MIQHDLKFMIEIARVGKYKKVQPNVYLEMFVMSIEKHAFKKLKIEPLLTSMLKLYVLSFSGPHLTGLPLMHEQCWLCWLNSVISPL